MKKLLIFIIILILNSTVGIFNSFAQTPPEGINYQAVARNTAGNALANANLNIHFIIRNGTISVYEETHSVTSNAYGLFTAVIGQGTQISTGTFSAIDWTTGTKSLEVLVDDLSGSGFVSMGTTQMMSVPYALYAKNAGSGTPGANGQNSLVKTTVEPAGSNCASGGFKTEYGLDANNNSTLDAVEINSALTKYVCNGLTGTNGTNGSNGISINWLGALATQPPTPSLNQAYYNTTSKKSFVYDGSAWQILAQDGSTGPAGSANINGATGNIIKFNGSTTGVSSKIFEDAAFNVGIGTSTPSYNLDVTGSGRYTGKLTVGAYTFPNTDGTANQILKTDGAGTLSWTFNNGNTYTNGSGLNLTANTFSLTTTGVTPGTYGNALQIPTFTVDAQGRLTAAGSVGITGALPAGITGQTLYNNAGIWTATNNLFNNGSAIGIGTTSPNNSSILDITSANKGLLIPRVALTSAIDVTTILLPAISLFIYNTATAGISPNDITPGYYYWDGTKWLRIATSPGALSPAWSLTGNAGTIPGTNFIGTTDLRHLIFKTNNIERMKIDSLGNIGIGNATPSVKLDVSGGSIRTVNNNGASLTAYSTASGSNSFLDFVAQNNVPAQREWRIINNGSAGGILEFRDVTQGLTQMFIDLSGNVSIGVASPNAKLDVGGTVAMGGFRMPTGANANYVLTTDASGNGTWQPAGGGGGWMLNGNPGTNPLVNYIGTTDLRHLVFRTNNIERMKIDSLGNVGIGTTKPKNKLSVKGSMAVNRITSPSIYTVSSNDYIIELTIGTALTLPPSASVDDGTIYVIRNRSTSSGAIQRTGTDTFLLLGSATTTNSITLAINSVLRLYLSGTTWVEW